MLFAGHATTIETFNYTHVKVEPPTKAPENNKVRAAESSAVLKKKKKQASAASNKHNFESARRLWSQVRKQAEKDANPAEELVARLRIALTYAWDERIPDKALELVDECLRDAQSIDLGDDRCLLLQLIGEAHRIKGNKDQARGFIISALEQARKIGSPRDEGFALLSLSYLERSGGRSEDNAKALENVELAYNAFSTLYASGNAEKQKAAKDGFVQCHCCKAEIFDHVRPDDALAEWTRALKLLEEIGTQGEWNFADTLRHRANLQVRIRAFDHAFKDLMKAAKIFERLNNTVGLAKCYLEIGEFFDATNRRVEAAKAYGQAASIAATWKNDSKASYYFFRYACKLVELRKFEEGEKIFLSLVNVGSLEREHKLTVITQLCLVAQVRGNDEDLKERCALALLLVDELIHEATSAEERRGLLIKKGQHLEQFGQHDEALQCFKKAIERFEAAGDQKGIIESWFHIAGVMRELGDRKKEREASEKVLALGAEKISRILAGLTLVMLAQLNIGEQRFDEAKRQIDRAEEFGPENPAVVMIAADLRSKLPQQVG